MFSMRRMSFVCAVACCLVVSSCGTGKSAVGSESSPDRISEMMSVDIYFDGGSLDLRYKMSDGSAWVVLYSRSMDDELDENAYHALSVRRASDKFGNKVSEPFARLEKGGAEERRIIGLLKDYLGSTDSKHDDVRLINEMLEEIAYRGKGALSRGNTRCGQCSMISFVSELEYLGPDVDFWTDTSEVLEKESPEHEERRLLCQEYSKTCGIGNLRRYDIRESRDVVFYVFEVEPEMTCDSMVVFVFDVKRAVFTCYFFLHMA